MMAFDPVTVTWSRPTQDKAPDTAHKIAAPTFMTYDSVTDSFVMIHDTKIIEFFPSTGTWKETSHPWGNFSESPPTQVGRWIYTTNEGEYSLWRYNIDTRVLEKVGLLPAELRDGDGIGIGDGFGRIWLSALGNKIAMYQYLDAAQNMNSDLYMLDLSTMEYTKMLIPKDAEGWTFTWHSSGWGFIFGKHKGYSSTHPMKHFYLVDLRQFGGTGQSICGLDQACPQTITASSDSSDSGTSDSSSSDDESSSSGSEGHEPSNSSSENNSETGADSSDSGIGDSTLSGGGSSSSNDEDAPSSVDSPLENDSSSSGSDNGGSSSGGGGGGSSDNDDDDSDSQKDEEMSTDSDTDDDIDHSGNEEVNSSYVFIRDLSLGSEGIAVLKLQKILNADPATRIAVSGPGSPGNETNYYGVRTREAVARFQEKYAKEILHPEHLLSGTGYFGPSTREKINSLISDGAIITQESGSDGKSEGGSTVQNLGQGLDLESMSEDELADLVETLMKQVIELLSQLAQKLSAGL